MNKEIEESSEKELNEIEKKLKPYLIEITYQIAMIRSYKEKNLEGVIDFSEQIKLKKELIDFYMKSAVKDLTNGDETIEPPVFPKIEVEK